MLAVVLAAVLAVAAALAGCGGSGAPAPSAQRTKLVEQISSQLQAGNAPAGLTDCVTGQTRGLATSQLRAIANSGANPPPATQQLAARLIATCLRQGHGIALIHELIAKGILSASGSLPTVYRNCIVTKANATTPAQLTQLITAYATQNPTAAESYARQVGRVLAGQCLADPRVLNTLRPYFLAPIRRSLQTTSAPFRNCVLAKAEHISAAELERFTLATSPTAARAFGEQAATSCIDAGFRP